MMSNVVHTKCLKCGRDCLGSLEEVEIFKGTVCQDCDTKYCLYIRQKAVMGYYDLPEVKDEIVEKIMREIGCVEGQAAQN